MLTLSHVSKKYGKFLAIEDINLELDNGLYGLLAPNGAGKTTLIKMITTLLTPTEGEILYDGVKIQEMGESYRDLLGYLPQQFGYYKNNTPVQYLDYLAALKGIPKKEAREIIKEKLALVGLSDVANKKMKKFSGGMLQRVGIAQALLNDPKILILDEPTAGLDPKGRDEILDQIALLQKKTGITVILVSHSMDDVAKYVDRIIVMNKGRVMYDDEPREVFRHYMELEKIGLAAPQVTYIMKDLQNQGIMVSDDVTTIDEAKEEIKNYFVRLAHEKSHDI